MSVRNLLKKRLSHSSRTGSSGIFAADTPQGIRDAFSLFDEDGDGRITRNEFLAALTRPTGASPAERGLTLSQDQAEMLFDEADVDCSGCISVEEFAQVAEL